MGEGSARNVADAAMIDATIEAHIAAAASVREMAASLVEAGRRVGTCLAGGGKVLLCGNGGSAADAQHIAAELVGRFLSERPGLPALALTTDTSALTAIANDYGFERVFARQIEALGRAGDVLIAISTSGSSPNILAAVEEARAREMATIGLVGRDGGKLASRVDLALVVRAQDTQRIQEMHILIGHLLCALVDDVRARP